MQSVSANTLGGLLPDVNNACSVCTAGQSDKHIATAKQGFHPRLHATNIKDSYIHSHINNTLDESSFLTLHPQWPTRSYFTGILHTATQTHSRNTKTAHKTELRSYLTDTLLILQRVLWQIFASYLHLQPNNILSADVDQLLCLQCMQSNITYLLNYASRIFACRNMAADTRALTFGSNTIATIKKTRLQKLKPTN